MAQFIIITDLDGTLLHPVTYSFEEAVPALSLIKEKKIPLVLCSSKTRAEIEVCRKRLGNKNPFISENGGGIFIPEGYFNLRTGGSPVDGPRIVNLGKPGKAMEGSSTPVDDHSIASLGRPGEAMEGASTPVDGYTIVSLGRSYREIREVFRNIRERTAIRVKGFGDMDAREMAHLTGLQLSDARLAKEREFDEPFIFEDGEERVREFLDAVEAAGFYWTQGRFYHILGDNDKGKAVKILNEYYERSFGAVVTIGLGDSLNDLPLLQEVEYPVLIPKEDGSYDERINLSNLIKAEGIGPEGWNKVIMRLIG